MMYFKPPGTREQCVLIASAFDAASLTCEACGQHTAVGVCSSPLGPMSNAMCRCCLAGDRCAADLLGVVVEMHGYKHCAPWVREAWELLLVDNLSGFPV